VHIPDGLIPLPQVWAAGYAVTGLATWYSLRQINRRPDPRADIPKASLLTAGFFVVSAIPIPVPPVVVHLVLNGLLGVVLGYFAFPAILIGLFFQAMVLGHGGMTTLGLNAAMIGVPALLGYGVFQLRHSLGKALPSRTALPLFGFLGGALGMGLSALIFLGLVITTIPSTMDAATEQRAILVLTVAHIPLMVLEGVFTALLVSYLQRVKPELLEG